MNKELAFPFAWHPEMGWCPNETPVGLTKRELFAAMAMQGLRAGNTRVRPVGKDYMEFLHSREIAEQAVEDADALIARLKATE